MKKMRFAYGWFEESEIWNPGSPIFYLWEILQTITIQNGLAFQWWFYSVTFHISEAKASLMATTLGVKREWQAAKWHQKGSLFSIHAKNVDKDNKEVL